MGPFKAPRLLNGLWQSSSPAWGSASGLKQDSALAKLVQAGLVAADMADHYGDAELVYGSFRNRLAADFKEQVIACTKWCVFRPIMQPVTPEFVLDAVKERSRRLGGRVELLQFHWYDYEAKEYLDILVELVGLTKSHPELVGAVGLCNFDSDHTQEACQHLIEKPGSVGIVSNQVQFSPVDSRPLQRMTAVCEKYGIKLLTYGSFCGGFLSGKWLGKPAPELYSTSEGLTPSQRKYFDMIQTWGTWTDFQTLLNVLQKVAQKHQVSLANVASRWILDQPSVGAVIVGTRLGVSSNVEDNLKVFQLHLDGDDIRDIDRAALGPGGEKSRAVYEKIGDCGGEYRNMH